MKVTCQCLSFSAGCNTQLHQSFVRQQHKRPLPRNIHFTRVCPSTLLSLDNIYCVVKSGVMKKCKRNQEMLFVNSLQNGDLFPLKAILNNSQGGKIEQYWEANKRRWTLCTSLKRLNVCRERWCNHPQNEIDHLLCLWRFLSIFMFNVRIILFCTLVNEQCINMALLKIMFVHSIPAICFCFEWHRC